MTLSTTRRRHVSLRCEYGICPNYVRFLISDGDHHMQVCGDCLTICVDQANQDTVRPLPLFVVQLDPPARRPVPFVADGPS